MTGQKFLDQLTNLVSSSGRWSGGSRRPKAVVARATIVGSAKCVRVGHRGKGKLAQGERCSRCQQVPAP